VRKVSSLTDAENADFHALFRALEPVLEAVVGADLVNLSCLRNWAYRVRNPDPPWRDGAPNPHVHWHVAPRYRTPRTIAGVVFEDEDFGEELAWRGRRVDPVVRRTLLDGIRGALPVTLID